MSSLKACLLAGVVTAFASTVAYAQDATTNPQPPTAVSSTQSAEDVGIADIIVTARKRAEAAQSVPLSITAFSPAILAERQIVTPYDLANNTSGLTLQASSDTQQVSVTIRGQNTLDSTLNLDPAIGIYVDGVYIGPQVGNAVAMNFDDAASVEVLKGPQGTFYGRNTTGGAIKIDHVVPEYQVDGWVKAGYGNYDLHSIAGAITLPLVDQVATLRLYGRYSDHDGYGRNTTINTEVQNERLYSFTGTLRLDPAAGLRIVVRGAYDHDRSGGPSIHPVADTLGSTLGGFTGGTNLFSIENLAIAATNGIPIVMPDFVTSFVPALTPANAALAQSLFFSQGPQGFYDMTSRFPTPNTLELYDGSVAIEYDVSDSVQLKSITAYRHMKTFRAVDFSGSFAASNITVEEPLTYHQFTQEVTLGGSLLENKLKYTFGGFYFKGVGRDISRTAVAPILGQVLGAASPLPTGLDIQDGEVNNRSFAVYGQASYEILPRLNITGGVRYTKEHKDLTTHNRFHLGTYNAANGFVDLFAPVLNVTQICSEPTQGVDDACRGFQPFSFSKITYTGSVDYAVNDSILLYGKISRGFRSGGGQLRLGGAGAPPFGPETLDDYEIGIKSDFFDHSLRVNLALYHDRISGLQRTFVQAVNGHVGAVVQNAGKARINGAEFDITYKPVREVTLGWSGAYTDPKYLDFTNPVNGADLSSRKFQAVGKFVWTLSGDYKAPTSFGSVDFNVNYWHTSDVSINPGGGADALGSAPWNTQKAYGLLNGRIAANLYDDKLTITAWGKNLTGKKYFSYNTDLTSSIGYAISFGNAPRTFGAEATYRF